MEDTGGEPDVIGRDQSTGEFLFVDCSPESPEGRRSVCYDPEALASRKEHKPKHSAIGMAAEMGMTSDRGAILPSPDPGHLRRQNLFLDPNSGKYPQPWWRTVLRLSIRHRLHLSQWRRVVLCVGGSGDDQKV